MVSWQDARDRLKKIKDDRLRRSEEVVELWETSLANHVGKLGDEVWTIYEQVCIAALDCDRLDISSAFVKKLDVRFPNSSRIRRLAGMNLEANGEFEEAKRMYEALIKSDETDTLSRKRLISILKTEKLYKEAIHELHDYLQSFQNDQEAWLEMSELYCHEHDYAKAAFCMEEVLLHYPHSHLHHQRYAEIRYAINGYDNIEIARTHFAKAAKLCQNNLDALYGLATAAAFLANSSKSTAQKKKDNQKYAEWAAGKILERHSEKLDTDAKSKVENINLLMNSLQL